MRVRALKSHMPPLPSFVIPAQAGIPLWMFRY
jgi:hypothetical protein